MNPGTINQGNAGQDLEAALLERARRLAQEHLDHGRDIRERILQEENDRLRLREERELLAAQEAAEHLYHQRLQASELKLREQDEQCRWALIKAVEEALTARVQSLADDQPRYRQVIQKLLAEAAECISESELVAELNAHDVAQFQTVWETLARQAAPGKQITLSSEPLSCRAGLLLRDRDNRVRVDNTFEGRMERLADELHRIISEHLFAGSELRGHLYG